MHAADGWINTQAMIISQRCVPCCRSAVFQTSRSRRRLPQVHRFPPEAIFDVNKRRDSNSDDLLHRRREERSSRLSSDHRQFLFEPGSARYFSTPPVTTVWSNYQTIFDDFFKVYFTKMATITKCSNWLFSSVQLHWVIFNLGQWLNSVDFCHVINHSSLWLVNRVTAVEYR